MKKSLLTAWMSGCLLFFAASGMNGAELKLNPVFTEHMMLQQERPVRFFGTAGKNSKITVEFAGQKKEVKADTAGKWLVEFPARKAGNTFYTLKVTDGKKTIQWKDLLVGDVWICAGQSNMEMPIGKTFRRGWSAQNCEQEVREADYPYIRYVDQPNRVSYLKKLPEASNRSWVRCTPVNASWFSATGYFFARQLHKDMQIPVGLINLTWSGTRIEPWISLEGYQNAGLAFDLNEIRKYSFDEEGRKKFMADRRAAFCKAITEIEEKMAAAEVKEKAGCAVYSKPDYDDSHWKSARAHTPAGSEICWFRTKFAVPASMKGKEIVLDGHWKSAEAAEVYLNGKLTASWKAGDPEVKKNFTLRLAADQLEQEKENTLAIRAQYHFRGNSWHISNLISRISLVSGKESIPLKNWKEKNEFVFDLRKNKVRGISPFSDPLLSPQFRCNLYNGMVHGWIDLPVKGVIWYQGCSNAGNPRYIHLMKAWIADWRAKWNQKDMPFLIVQLAGYGDGNWKKSPPRQEPNYPLTRDIQAQMIKDPNVGLACAIDIGEPTNIHPANKQEVGRRLALEAERIVYGKKIVSRGPFFKDAKVEGKAIRVSYDYAENGLKTADGKAPRCFAIAGEDKNWVWADAVIDGKTVLVSSAKIPAPKYVRYAYAMYRGDCNLQNKEGLPAYPFRSDAYDYSKVKK